MLREKEQKEKRGPSVKRMALRYFALLMGIVLLFLILSSAYSIWIYLQQLGYCSEATQTVTRNNLIQTLDQLEDYNRNKATSDADFSLLSYQNGHLSDTQRMTSLFHLQRDIQSRVPVAGAILLFDRTGSIFYYAMGNSFHSGLMTLSDMEFMHGLHQKLLLQTDDALNRWQVMTIGGYTALVNAFRLRDLYICSMLDLESFSRTYIAGMDNIHCAFYSKDAILTGEEYMEEKGINIKDLIDPPKKFWGFFTGKDVIQTEYLPKYGIGLAAVISATGIWRYSRMYIVIVLGVTVCILVTIFAVYSMLKKALIYPLDQITKASRRLMGAAEPEQTQLETNLTEFVTIRTALDSLVEQKVELARESENREQERNHALLQYYQLQTRSHFFLNCLKSIYSLTEKGETEKTKRMIMLFSNHLRYVFHDTLSFVPLRAELAEVKDYHQIIQLDRTSPVMLDVQVPQPLLEVNVPPLTIQTFIENSYKYNNDGNKMLVFRIVADRIEMEEKAYLRLRLSDDGKGYSAQNLADFETMGELFGTHHVGISNLRRRINILYHGDYQMGFCNGADGGAVTVIYLPMESKEDT